MAAAWAVTLGWPLLARAQPEAELPSAGADGAAAGDDASEPVASVDRPVATLLAIAPGVFLHGSGQFALGHRDEAYQLLAMQGMGAGLIVLGAIPFALTSASRYLSAPGIGAVLTGLSMAAGAWFSDLYASATPPELRGAAPLRLPSVEAELGYRYVYDPSLRYGNVVVTGLDVWLGGLRLAPSASFAVDGIRYRWRALAGYRYFGPRGWPEPPAGNGSYVEMDVAVTHGVDPTNGIDMLELELAPRGRFDYALLSPALRGAFSDLSLGFAMQRFDYELPAGMPSASDTTLTMLGRAGFGIYLGSGTAPYGEISAYYDHRHDDFAAGYPRAFVGIGGHVGLSAELMLTEQLGLRTLVELGGSLVTGASLLVRQGAEP